MGDENDDPAKTIGKSVKGSSRATTPGGKDGTAAGSRPVSPAKSVKSGVTKPPDQPPDDLPEVRGAPPPPMDAINARIAALEDLARHSLGAAAVDGTDGLAHLGQAPTLAGSRTRTTPSRGA